MAARPGETGHQRSLHSQAFLYGNGVQGGSLLLPNVLDLTFEVFGGFLPHYLMQSLLNDTKPKKMRKGDKTTSWHISR
jgi:hypothetical protein